MQSQSSNCPSIRSFSKLIKTATGVALAWLCASPALAITLAAGDIVVTATQIPAENGDAGLLLVDPATGNRTILSDDLTQGTGVPFGAPTGVSLAPNGDLLVADDGNTALGPRLVIVDPATGNRSIISGDGVGTGPALVDPGLAEYVDGQLILLDSGTGNNDAAIFSIDPATGNRTLLSGDGVGTGQALTGAFQFVAANGHLFVPNYTQNSILSVDLTTGDRTVISGPGVGAGPTLIPAGLTMDGAGHLLTTSINGDNNGLFSVDPITGDRTAISTSQRGTGPFGGLPLEIALQANGNVVMTCLGVSQGDIVTIDPTTGNRTLLSSGSIGTGPSHGTGPSFDPGGVLVVPTPEPSTFILAALGGVVLLARRRRIA